MEQDIKDSLIELTNITDKLIDKCDEYATSTKTKALYSYIEKLKSGLQKIQAQQNKFLTTIENIDYSKDVADLEEFNDKVHYFYQSICDELSDFELNLKTIDITNAEQFQFNSEDIRNKLLSAVQTADQKFKSIKKISYPEVKRITSIKKKNKNTTFCK